MLVRNICPACCSDKQRHCFVVNGFNITRCLACDTLFVKNLPTLEELELIYTNDEYYELTNESLQRIADENIRRLQLIKKIKSNGKFLDIGCAQGLLLDEAKKNGFQTYGIEPTRQNADIAITKGHTVESMRLDEFVHQCGTEFFDVIACLDVIEHIDNPNTFLKLASSLLKPDGLMILSTPNYSCIIEKALGANAPYMTPPEHVTFFTTSGIKHLVTSCDLRVVSFQTFGNLIPAEINRSIKRFLPKYLHPFKSIIYPIVRFAFWLMNLMKIGLEQELYLKKTIDK
jgi:2-polyprenyl-3-methyl-5-hydroxy-6-metoxy-1,4-benzoquinol methylase